MWTRERVVKEKPMVRIAVDGREVLGRIMYVRYAKAEKYNVRIVFELNGEEDRIFPDIDEVVNALNEERPIYA